MMKNPYFLRLRSHILVLATAFIALLASASLHAQVVNPKVLIIGSTQDSPRAGSQSDPFPATEIRNELASILSGAGHTTANVTLLNRDTGTYSLAQWFHHPSPANVETTTRWPNLRGETTPWDYVILIGDPYTMEYMPGLYAQGVAAIAEEVAKGTGEVILLMPWPTGNGSSVAHYKEVVYRTGRSGGHKVVPAGLAWNNDTVTPKPTPLDKRGAYICAASIYSTIWNQSASNSSYSYDDTLADAVQTTVTNNVGAAQYTGTFNFQNPFLMLGDLRREAHFSDKGSSTETAFARSVESAMDRCRISYYGTGDWQTSIYKGKYNSNTPEDDGKGWPTNQSMPIAWNHGRKFSEVEKEYVVNPDYWQLGMGFMYQTNTWGSSVESANDTHIGQIYSKDLDLVDYMKGQDATARIIPVRLLWAQIHKAYPALNPLSDGTGPHLNGDLAAAVGTYMYTLYSGRCPLNPPPSTMNASWFAQKVGYETAWRTGRCQSRAPGFKVMPSSSTALTVSSTTTETMTVQFILPPTSNVTVTVSSSNTAVGTVSPQQLVFTPQNFSTPQTVTVERAPELTASATFNVVFTTTSTDEVYNNLQDSWKYIALKDNDLHTITVAAIDTDCTEASISNVGLFQLTRSGLDPYPLTVNYTLGGAAVNGTDYNSLTGSVTFPLNSNTVYVTIKAINDTDYEGPEDVTLTLDTNASYLIGSPSTASLTITDNDKPTVSIASSLVSTQEGGSNPVITFSRTGATGVGPLTVAYTVAGTASMGSDYGFLSGVFTIPKYQSSATLAIPIFQDDISEMPEIITLTVPSNAAYAYTVASSPNNAVSITIADDFEPIMVAITATDAIASEPLKGDGTGSVTITRSRATGTALTVNLQISGTATAGSDYDALPTTVTIPSGETSATITITTVDDEQAEVDETVILTLQAGSGYLIGTSTTATVNLYDDEPTQVRVEINDAKCIEGATADTGKFLLRRLGIRTTALTVNYTISGSATSGSDYTALTGSAAIGANGTSATVTVTPINDSLVEGTETVILTLDTGTDYTMNTQNADMIEIRDDETVDVTVSAQDANCAEQATPDNGNFRITRAAASASPLTVSYTITGTATNGVDYTSLSGTATIAASATTVDVALAPLSDGILEGSESVIMNLTGAGPSYDIGDARSATIWIKDDDSPFITLTATDNSAAEADGGSTNQGLFTFTASFPPASDLTIYYTVGTNNGIDCEFLPGSIVLPAGQTTVTLPVIPIDDELAEPNENIGVTLANGDGYNVVNTSGVNVSIVASDIPQATIVALDPNATENPIKTGRFAIRSTKVFASNTTVKYTVGGTATSTSDFTALAGTVTIYAGTNSALITVTPLDDALAEGTETIVLTLSLNGTAYTISSPSSAVVNIADDEVVAPLIAWKQAIFGADWTDEALAGDTADADGDGQLNLLEYALGTNPTVQDSGSLATDGSVNGSPVPKDAGGGVFEYYFVRRKDHGTSGSVSYTVQFSDDLTGFTGSVVTPTFIANSSADPDYEVVKVPFPGGFRFGRLQIESAP